MCVCVNGGGGGGGGVGMWSWEGVHNRPNDLFMRQKFAKWFCPCGVVPSKLFNEFLFITRIMP